MRIGLYLQDYRKNRKSVFVSALDIARRSKLDLLVFPEHCYTPHDDDLWAGDIRAKADRKRANDRALAISKSAGCAVMGAILIVTLPRDWASEALSGGVERHSRARSPQPEMLLQQVPRPYQIAHSGPIREA